MTLMPEELALMNSTRRIQLTILLLVALLFPLSAQATPAPQGHIQPTANHLSRTAIPNARPEGLIDEGLRGRSGPLGVVIELQDTPSALVFARAQRRGSSLQATQTAQLQLAQVERAQQSVLAPLSQLGAQVIYRTQRVYNGIAAHVDASKLEQIARLPGVKAIHPLVRHYPSLSSSVPLIGAPQLWAGSGLPATLTGVGIKVAVIDTGIDYIHAGFGGSGLQADYDRNDTTSIGDSPALFPTARVVAGYDFAGDDYNGNNTPQPDPDPMDCNGHGSHVAGIAVGNGVTDTGAAYTGPYNATTHQNVNFRIGPGVAPQASLIGLRVFGCDGSTELVNQAIEWAVDPNGDGNFADRVDVINMSLGSDFGHETDATSVAADNAVEAGVIVVTSAGNDGDSTFITGSPGTSPRVISVASSVDAADVIDGFRENAPTPTTWPASFSVAYDWAGMAAPVTADLVYPPDQRSACAAFSSANQALIAGKIVLVDWTEGECGSVARGANLVAAGAVGAILADNSDVFDLFITGSAAIPMVSAPKSVGDALKAKLPGTVNISLSNQYTASVPYDDPQQVDTLSSFSSRGPRRDGSVLKPDVSAPGQGIFSVATGTGSSGTSISGTSMAAPHIAGSMALLRQLHPTWSIEELKALVMNTAVTNLRAGLDPGATLLAPMRVGAGRADLPRAAASDVVAYAQGDDGLVSVSFGSVEVLGTTTLTRTIQVVNKGASPATYNLAYVPATTIPGVTYALSAPSVTVGAGATATVDVTMSANGTQMKHVIDPTLSTTQAFGTGQLGRPWLSEASGYLALTEAGLAAPTFAAWINGSQENPPADSDVTATATFTYNSATGQIDYAVTFASPITLTAAHFHSGAAGQNGPVRIPIATGDNTFGPGDPLAGSAALPAADLPALLRGGLYVNFHTAAYPGGEIRGQVVPSLDDTALRLPVYANARPASAMSATGTIDLSDTATTTATLALAGSGVNTGLNYPQDIISLVSAFELQHSSPNEAASGLLTDEADLAYVGVASDVASTSTFTETMLSFGLATHGDWSSPNQVEFDIYIDTNRDGTDDFVLFNSNGGWMTGNDQNDLLLTFLLNLETNDLLVQNYINSFSPSDYDTAVFNTNVLVLPVYAADLGLTAASSRFNYRVESFGLDATTNEPTVGGAISGRVDQTGTLTYDAANPGIDTSGGFAGAPTYDDLPGGEIPLAYNRAAFEASRSQGVLLLHHMNRRGERAEVLLSQPALNVIGSSTGKPGSYFNLEGRGFAPQEAVAIAVDGRTVATYTANAEGRVPFVLFFSSVAPLRSYTITATSVAQPAQSAQAELTIDSAATLLPRPGDSALPVANVLPTLYLPLVRR
jgi:subtilisin family serine protease